MIVIVQRCAHESDLQASWSRDIWWTCALADKLSIYECETLFAMLPVSLLLLWTMYRRVEMIPMWLYCFSTHTF